LFPPSSRIVRANLFEVISAMRFPICLIISEVIKIIMSANRLGCSSYRSGTSERDKLKAWIIDHALSNISIRNMCVFMRQKKIYLKNSN
jgi:hypothetical protein